MPDHDVAQVIGARDAAATDPVVLQVVPHQLVGVELGGIGRQAEQRILPNRGSCLRLSSALAMEQSEEWLTGHRYLDIHVLEEEQPETADLPMPAAIEVTA